MPLRKSSTSLTVRLRGIKIKVSPEITVTWCPGKLRGGEPAPPLHPPLIYIVKTRGSNTHLRLQIHFGNYCKMTRCDWNDINFQELKTSQILHPPKVVAATLHKSKRRGTRPCVPELSHFPCSNVPIYIIYTEKPGSCTFLHCLSSFGELQSRQLAQPGKTEIPSNIWRYLKFIFLWKVFESRSDIDKIGKALAPFLFISRTIWWKREQRVLEGFLDRLWFDNIYKLQFKKYFFFTLITYTSVSIFTFFKTFNLLKMLFIIFIVVSAMVNRCYFPLFSQCI